MGIHLEFRIDASLEPTDHQRFCGNESCGKLRRQHLAQSIVQRRRQTIGHRPLTRHIDADALRIAADDELTERLPLRIQIAARPRGLIGLAERISIDGQAIDRAIGFAMEHEHGGATSGETRLRYEREIHRIFGVLAIDHEPHIEFSLGHQAR